MDIKIEKDNYKFILRTSVKIHNQDQTKILMWKSPKNNNYMLPGGKIKELEQSIDAIKREIEEELGLVDLKYEFDSIEEKISNDDNIQYQIIDIIYRTMIDNNIEIINKENYGEFVWKNIE